MKKISLKGLVTLVTGSASALGSHVRQRLALNGSKILAVDLDHKTIVEEDSKLKAMVSFITGDVTDPQFVQNLFIKYNKCDAVVNCAAAYKSYNYMTSYLVSKHALDVIKNNDMNAFGCRGCVVNVIGLQQKYDEKYFEEQDVYSKKYGETFDSLDDKVMQLAEELTANRIRSNTVIVPPNSDPKLFSQIIQNIIEDQYIAGQVINLQDDYRPYLGTLKQIMADYHVPPDPEKRVQLSPQKDSTNTPILQLEDKKQ